MTNCKSLLLLKEKGIFQDKSVKLSSHSDKNFCKETALFIEMIVHCNILTTVLTM